MSRDTLEQIDVARLLIDKYHDVSSSYHVAHTASDNYRV